MSEVNSPASLESPEATHELADEGELVIDDQNDADFEDSRDEVASDEEESEGSDVDETPKEYSGIKEQMYQDKLGQLKRQLQLLREGSHPEYAKKLKKLDAAYKERLRMNDLWRDMELESVERDYLLEKRLAVSELEEKKTELQENLLMELDEKKKIVEHERYSLDLNLESMEYKPISTRKLRRRGNEPPPVVENKRRKPTNCALMLQLEDREIDDDLRLINKSKLLTIRKHPLSLPISSMPEILSYSNEPRIEAGKLYFDRKWFQKGQAVTIECKDGSRFNGVLTMAGGGIIMVRKVPDNIRMKITLAQLSHGKYLVRRRSAS